MNEPVDLWAQEIRDYLLGRLAKSSRIEDLAVAQTTELQNPPVRRWWTFEGKRYTSLSGSLAGSWHRVIAQAQRLEQTFNPRLRLNDRAEGLVDWPRTLGRGPRQLHSEFIVRSSGVGLDDDERAALRGWATWISNEWFEYTSASGSGQRLDWRNFSVDSLQAIGADRLRRWAHTARRSRWALLRDVVAESLRPILEPSELDRIPLPSDRAQLFELLCLVRIAKELAPVPVDLRWLNHDMTDNVLGFPGLQCFYQQSLRNDVILATSEYEGSLATAVSILGVATPKVIDIAFDFDAPRVGFDGIIVEAKSGSQQYEAAVMQLRVYKAARSRRLHSRYLIWGVIEQPKGSDTTREQVQRILSAATSTEDVWIFSSASAISMVLQTVFGPLPGNMHEDSLKAANAR